jgi:hypothetical protein
MNMFKLPVLLFAVIVFTTTSCQKMLELAPEPQPKVGTQWVYDSTNYFADGRVKSTGTVTYTADSEVVLGNEKWLKIVNGGGKTIWYLHKNTGGLYQYANNASNLFLKYPAVLNDTYNTYNEGNAESFKVTAVSDTVELAHEFVDATRYEGTKNSMVVDKIWFNSSKWIVQKDIYGRNFTGLIYYRKSHLLLQKVVF